MYVADMVCLIMLIDSSIEKSGAIKVLINNVGGGGAGREFTRQEGMVHTC